MFVTDLGFQLECVGLHLNFLKPLVPSSHVHYKSQAAIGHQALYGCGKAAAALVPYACEVGML